SCGGSRRDGDEAVGQHEGRHGVGAESGHRVPLLISSSVRGTGDGAGRMANRSIAFCHAERPIDSRRCREYERAGFGLVAVRGGSVSWPGGGRCVGVRLRAAVRSAVALAALLALFVPSPARGATWTPVQMPNVTDHPDSDL